MCKNTTSPSHKRCTNLQQVDQREVLQAPKQVQERCPNYQCHWTIVRPDVGVGNLSKISRPWESVVNVHIIGTIIPHTLIDLGAAINMMTRDTMLKLNLQGSLRNTSTVLQLADGSTVTPEGIMEDVMVSINFWEYPADFLVLQPKAKLTRYHLILGRPWLATADAYISF